MQQCPRDRFTAPASFTKAEPLLLASYEAR